MKKITLFFWLITAGAFAQNSVNLQHISTHATGIFDEAAAEILAYDPSGQFIFYTNADDNEIGVLDISDLNNITKTEITLPDGGVNSVDYYNGHIAVALEDTNKQADGQVLFYTTSGTLVTSVKVGALPDMVTFSPNGQLVLTANEGEPNDDYSVDPLGTVSIIDVSGGISNVTQSDVTTLDFTAFNSNIDPLVRINGNNGLSSVAQDLEPEYVAVSEDNQTAYVALQENNAIAILDLTTKTITSVEGLGYKDWSAVGNTLDASDKRSDVFFSNYDNLFGMYMPDAMKFFSVNNNNYLITANEGDGREYDNFEDEDKVGKIDLDTVVFPNYATLQEDTVLGRLVISITDGDTDNDGEFEALYAFGARSFSIWNADTRQLVYDSGDDIEKRVFALEPAHFNSTNDDNDSFKNRSDNKGPEPEAVTVAKLAGYTLAFVGLERQGGIITYDISDPTNPQFLGYTNNRNYNVDADKPGAGDLGPEDIIYIDPAESPNGKPLLVVANEVSGTVSFFEITSNFISLEENNQNTLKMHPNPTTGFVNLSAKDHYNILDLSGNTLFKTQYTDRINFSNLEAGVYLIQSSNGLFAKIIKQ